MPGVTNSPRASIVFAASAASIFDAIAGNLPGRNRDVSNRVHVVARIDHVPALQQQVVDFGAAATWAANIEATSRKNEKRRAKNEERSR